MVSLYNINPDSANDGQQRSLEDFQFDLENVLTMSQLVGKSAEERNAATVMLDILAGAKNKTAAEVAAEIVTEASTLSGQLVLCAVLAANTAGRSKVIVREDTTKNGAWAARKVWPRIGRDEFHRSVPVHLAEREAVQRRMARAGQKGLETFTRFTELAGNRAADDQLIEKHLRLRAPMAWQEYLSTINHQQSPQPMDISAVMTSAQCQCCGSQIHQNETVGTKTKRVRNVENVDNWQRYAEVETHNRKEAATKVRGRSTHRKHTCSNCGHVGHSRAVCQNTNTQEIEKEVDEHIPEVTDEEAWCIAVQDVVSDGHCHCTEVVDMCPELCDESEVRECPELCDESKVRECTEHRDESKVRKIVTNIETCHNSKKVITNIETCPNLREVIANSKTGKNSEKWRDEERRMKEFVRNALADQELEQAKLKHFVMSMVMDQTIATREHEIIHGEDADGSKV